ncbi:hypothetical protein YC2023_065570 [Brassica napus]
MLQLYLGNLSAIKPSHYGAFKDLRKEINYLDSAILLYFYILSNEDPLITEKLISGQAVLFLKI